MSLLGRLLGDPEDARDVYQDTWCSIWQALPRLRREVDPWPFIRTAAVRKAVDRLRKRGTDRSIPIGEEPADWRTQRRGGEEHKSGPDLAFLPARERTALTLFFWEGLSVREIATELGAPEGTIKTLMFRGRKRLRERLMEQNDEV